jgi:hypothetical protein
MSPRRRISVLVAVLAATLLVQAAAPIASAWLPRARHYHQGGPITLDTRLLSRSGASAWAIDEYLRANTSLPRLGAAFMAAERKYGVNARFLLAAAMHESAWGRSDIARYKHNLFGYNAYDRDPYRYASAYRTYAANIADTARFMKEMYLTPGGRWWGGQPTLRSMQQYWSSSGRWGESVSRVARSIHLPSLKGRSIRFARPAIGDLVHTGNRVTVRLEWSGGAIPAGIGFVATWVPVELDADLIASPVATRVKAHATTVKARRTRTAGHAITLSIAAPSQPGTYRLRLALRDLRGQRLPRADRVAVPTVDVRVWADRAARVDLEPSPGGTGVTVRITNTGREVIPAVRAGVPSTTTSDTPVEAVESVLTVSATGGDPASSAPVVLIEERLPHDLAPGESVTFRVPGINAATGRTTNWLVVDLHVLDDPAWLAGSVPAGAWRTPDGLGTVTRDPSAFPSRAIGIDVDPVMAAASPPPAPAIATPAPAIPTSPPTPAPAATATPKPTLTPTPVATPAATPKPSATPKPTTSTTTRRHVTRSRSEHYRTVSYRGRWGNAQYQGYLGGNVTWSTTAGASARFTFTGTSVAWVGPLGPTRGRALVLIDGRAVATVNLWRSTFVARAVLFKRTFKSTGKHTLTIKVLSSPGHQNVSIDGFIVRT